MIETRDPDVVGDDSGLIVKTTYDAAGDVLTVTRDALHNGSANSSTKLITHMTYDALGRKLTHSDADSGTTTFTYNAVGDVISQTDAKGQTITQSFDALGRRWQRTTSTGDDNNALTDTWTYDIAAHGYGQLAATARTSTHGLSYSRALSYDAYGRGLSVDTSVAGHAWSQTSAYDGYGRPLAQQDASGYTLSTHYTTHGFVDKLTDSRAGTLYQIHTMSARGQVSSSERGGNAALMSTSTFNAATGRVASICSGSNCNLQDLAYQYDQLGNLTQRERDTHGYPTIERFSNDALNRLTQAKLTKVQGYTPGQAIITAALSYDLLGNICTKNSVAYHYAGPAGCANHGSYGSAQAVTQAGNISYQYDADGNQTTSTNGRTLIYNALNQLTTASNNSEQTTFQYAPSGARFIRTDSAGSAAPPTGCPAANDRIFCNGFEASQGGSSGPQTTYYVGNVEIIQTGSSVEKRRYLAGVAIDYVRSGGGNETRYTFADPLGSISAIANSSGGLIEAMSFAPDGHRRNPTTWQGAAPPSPSTTHGFTGHEHIDALGLIHMNGRIYDPKLGRMLQADPLGDPGNQGLNRYSYVLNNPLSLTDPTGYSSFGDIVKIVAAIVITYYTAGWGASLWASESYGAAILVVGAGGMAAGYVTTGTTRGALYGAFSAELFFGVGEAFDGAGWAQAGEGQGVLGSNLNSIGYTSAILAHGVAGGIVSSLEGGKFGSGFLSAAVTEATSGAIDHLDPWNPRGQAVSSERIVAAAIVGGTVSRVTGGKFSNGAYSAAFSQVFSDGIAVANNPHRKALPGNWLARQGKGLADLAGKLWTLPNTTVGLAFGGIGYLAGLAMGTDPSIKLGHNAIEFLNSPLMGSAMTIGNVIVFGTGPYYQPATIQNLSGLPLGYEEMQHTWQAEVLGPLYLPAHVVFGVTAETINGNWHGSANLLERGPHSSNPEPWQ